MKKAYCRYFFRSYALFFRTPVSSIYSENLINDNKNIRHMQVKIYFELENVSSRRQRGVIEYDAIGKLFGPVSGDHSLP